MQRASAILPQVSACPPIPALANARIAYAAYSTDTAKSKSASRTSMCQRLRRCAIAALATRVHSRIIRRALTEMDAASG